MFEEEIFKDTLWNEHISAPALMCSIISSETGEYLGYCGIKDSSLKKWEIDIELHKAWCGKGVGYISIQKFHVNPRKLLSHVLEYKLVWNK